MEKGSPWTNEDVKALISVWPEANIQQQLDGSVRNASVFQEISKRLHEAGVEKDWEQCRAKVKNLKTLYKKVKYKKVKDSNGRSRRGRKSCQFFDNLDAILGSRPATQPPIVVESLDNSKDSSTNNGESVMERQDSVTGRAATFSKFGDSSLNEVEEETEGQAAQPPAKERRLMKKK